MLISKDEDKETAAIIDETAKNIIAAYDVNNLSSVADWEVDQLLEWTSGLNFDE